MSCILRIGGNLSQIEKSFRGVSACPSFARERGKGNHLSAGGHCGSAILKEMMKVLSELEKHGDIVTPIRKPKAKVETPKEQPKGMVCPECGEPLIKTNGCVSCTNCGFSFCG